MVAEMYILEYPMTNIFPVFHISIRFSFYFLNLILSVSFSFFLFIFAFTTHFIWLILTWTSLCIFYPLLWCHRSVSVMLDIVCDISMFLFHRFHFYSWIPFIQILPLFSLMFLFVFVYTAIEDEKPCTVWWYTTNDARWEEENAHLFFSARFFFFFMYNHIDSLVTMSSGINVFPYWK